MNGGDDSFDVLELRTARALAPSPALPAALVPMEPIDPASAVATRTFRLNGRRINFHVHGVRFQVLSIGGGAPPPELAGWKDTIFVNGKRTVRVIVRFPAYADPDVPYMFHCHLLYHEDRGMMGQFVVVAPGQPAGHVGNHAGDG